MPRKTQQPSLTKLVGIHVSQIRRYESGDFTPTLEVLRKLAIALSLSADTFVFATIQDRLAKTQVQ